MSGGAFEAVWERIGAHAGEFFKTDAGSWFTYGVEGDELVPSHAKGLRIPRAELEKAFPLLPVPPAKLNKVVKGPKYVWAILHDTRISEGAW